MGGEREGIGGSASTQRWPPGVRGSGPLAQHHIQLVDGFRPVGVVAEGIAQKACLGRRPERRVGQLGMAIDGMVADKTLLADVVTGQPQLGKQGGAMSWVSNSMSVLLGRGLWKSIASPRALKSRRGDDGVAVRHRRHAAPACRAAPDNGSLRRWRTRTGSR